MEGRARRPWGEPWLSLAIGVLAGAFFWLDMTFRSQLPNSWEWISIPGILVAVILDGAHPTQWAEYTGVVFFNGALWALLFFLAHHGLSAAQARWRAP